MSGGILIAGGGTGGHIYPAIAIAQAIRKEKPSLAVDFVGTKRGLEGKIIPREGFKLHFISAGALNNVGLFRKIFSLLLLPWGFIQSLFLLLALKPKLVLGVGGYASGPTMLAACLLRKKLALFESNAYPGLTNRWLAKIIDKAFVNFEVSQNFFRNSILLGMPVRKGLEPHQRKSSPRLRILIFGGSQGARGINNTVVEAFKKGGPWTEKVQVVHQIGSLDFASVDRQYNLLNPSNVQWHEFLYDMPERYAWADLVICRAGASTLAEVAACQKAAILIPFPFAADNHQQTNGEALAEKGAAILILQKDFTAEKFIQIISSFVSNRTELEALEKNVGQFFKAAAAESIAKSLLEDLA